MRIEALACYNIHQTHEGTMKRLFEAISGGFKEVESYLYSKVKKFTVDLCLAGQCNEKMAVPACGKYSWIMGFLLLGTARL